MTKLLEDTIAKARQLPPTRQDEAAELLWSVVDQDPETVRLTPNQIAEVERHLANREDSAPHEEVRAFFQRG